MKSALNFTIVLGVAAMGCAPVASSVPKLSGQTPRSGDTVLAGNSVRTVKTSATRVIPSDGYQEEENRISQTHRILKLKRDEVQALFENREVTVPMALTLARVDFIPMVEIKTKSENFDTDLRKSFALSVLRTEDKSGEVRLLIVKEKTSSAALSFVKKNAVSVSIAYREEEIR